MAGLNKTFPGCSSIAFSSSQNLLIVRVESWYEAWQLQRENLYYFAYLSKYLGLNAVEIHHATPGKPKLRIPAILCTNFSFESPEMRNIQNMILSPALNNDSFFELMGLVDDDWLRLASEIHSENNPCFLVSMDYHRNILFNKAAVDLLHTTPDKLLQKPLPKMWVSQPQPIDYYRSLPNALIDFNQALRCNSASYLENFKFQNWKENAEENTAEWVEWRDNIEYKELPNGGHARKMVVLEWSPVSVPV